MISYVTVGDGKPLVLLHGWGFDKHIWDPLVPQLVEKNFFKLYLIDLPGFGKTPTMDWVQFKQQLFKLLPDKFSVLGWSLGGLYATRLCIEEPIMVEKLINVASSPKFVSADNWVGIDARVLSDFYQKFVNDPKQTRYEFVKNQLGEHAGVSLRPSNALNLIGFENGLDMLLNWDLRNQLFTIQQPGLFIFGRLDSIVSRKLMPLLQDIYPDFKYIMFKKSAHMPFLSNTDEFIEEVVRFLN